MPDGIERAEPTIAPPRHRLTSELANSRFHHIQTDLEAGPTVATTIGIAITTSLEECQVVSHILSKTHRNVLFLASSPVSPLKQFGCCFWGPSAGTRACPSARRKGNQMLDRKALRLREEVGTVSEKSVTRRQTRVVGEKRAVGTPLISLKPARVANLLCRGREKRTLRKR